MEDSRAEKKRNELLKWNPSKSEKVFFSSDYYKGKFKFIVSDFSAKKSDAFGKAGYVVCSGKANSMQANKRYEAIFEPPDESKWKPLSSQAIGQLSFMNSKAGKKGLAPEGNWEYWLKASGWPEPKSGKTIGSDKNSKFSLPGIPVYFIGEPKDCNDTTGRSFFMGLSRVIKVPYDSSVGDVAARSTGQKMPPYKVPKLEEKIDFARAIFGDVEEALGEAGKKTGDSDRLALKGRVAFEFARSNDAVLDPATEAGVFMGPRASYWPFYLKNRKKPSQSASYNAQDAILAGRKRYPLRENTIPLLKGEGKVVSKLQFIKAGANFKGRIIFHNLHPVELGALLWALKMPSQEHQTRHSLGRAKAFGYGRLRCSPSLNALPNQGGKRKKEPREFINQFETYMEEQFSALGYSIGWKASPAVAALLKMADPALGEKHKANLASLSGPKVFQTIKNDETTLPDDYVKNEDWKAM